MRRSGSPQRICRFEDGARCSTDVTKSFAFARNDGGVYCPTASCRMPPALSSRFTSGNSHIAKIMKAPRKATTYWMRSWPSVFCQYAAIAVTSTTSSDSANLILKGMGDLRLRQVGPGNIGPRNIGPSHVGPGEAADFRKNGKAERLHA